METTAATSTKSRKAQTCHGSCHCGAVRYDVEIDLARGGSRCNCSICLKLGNFSGMAKPDAFRLVCGEGELGSYAWGAKISTRYFCQRCGVQCFGKGSLPELGGEYVAVNLNTLDDVEVGQLKAVHWDGRNNNWEAGPRDAPWRVLD